MDLEGLIERSKNGDWQAFAELVRLHQSLAFACAFAVLGDFHLAEDATQEAFATAYGRLHTLRSAEAFPWWLRGIVRHQCSRFVRRARVAVVPLEEAAELHAHDASLDQQVIAQTTTAAVVAAINALPLPEREVLALFYAKDSSRQQIADFLAVPLTTVNNRLHSARKHLKRSLLPMAKDTFETHALPPDFAANVGKLLNVRGPVVEMQFDPAQRPPLLSVVRFNGGDGTPASATVAQYLDDGRVRGVASALPHIVTPGATVEQTGAWPDDALGSATLKDVFATLAAAPPRPEVIETGIKCIDLFAPLQKGGRVAVLGAAGVGKMVVIEELIHNVRARDAALRLWAFVKPGAEMHLVQGTIEEATQLRLSLEPLIALAADQSELGSLTDVFDAVIVMSLSRAFDHLWPAVDVLRSRSRLLDPALVGADHVRVAEGVRDLLRRYGMLSTRIREGAVYELTAEEVQVIKRGRRIERFLTQRFVVAEEWTKHPGAYVSIGDTVASFDAILQGAGDDLPEDAFLYAGTFEDVRQRVAQA
jgi:RNA polymerase sigma factor (sigma-70 family)